MIFIGTLRRFLMLPGSWRWNGWVRGITAKYEGGWLIRSSSQEYERRRAKGLEA